MLDVFGIERSLSGKGCPYDNAVDEPANKILKAELVYREAFGTTRELWVKLADYVHWYNNFRMHSTLGYMTSVEFRKAGLVLPRIVQKDVANPEVTSCTPWTPRPLTRRRNLSHESCDSVSTTDRPSTRRQPPSSQLIAVTTAVEATRPSRLHDQVHGAALPRRALEHLGYCPDEPLVRIAHDELHANGAALPDNSEECES